MNKLDEWQKIVDEYNACPIRVTTKYYGGLPAEHVNYAVASRDNFPRLIQALRVAVNSLEAARDDLQCSKDSAECHYLGKEFRPCTEHQAVNEAIDSIQSILEGESDD